LNDIAQIAIAVANITGLLYTHTFYLSSTVIEFAAFCTFVIIDAEIGVLKACVA
jgi:hypothetical protein